MKEQVLLVDSNVLVYAINRSSPKHKVAQDYLQAHVGQIVLAHQNILESLRVLTHKKFQYPMSPGDAIEAISSIAERCHVIAPDPGSHHIALALVQKHDLAGDKIFDAYLAATALSAGIGLIVTDNSKDFLVFENIMVINPFSLD